MKKRDATTNGKHMENKAKTTEQHMNINTKQREPIFKKRKTNGTQRNNKKGETNEKPKGKTKGNK